ncbi:hypothetical protein GF1_32070 [Desulfolithobacter dissulfuricans]|uniref:Uncharacterized protein n=1 Tax=Desulfolithobacter dissulfuricans TaxID=2795293 RepID=A0A915U3T6_9BACT|nr:hypothetical protein GF1_32070 [Desulfolithobacter dissulfuricans]
MAAGQVAGVGQMVPDLPQPPQTKMGLAAQVRLRFRGIQNHGQPLVVAPELLRILAIQRPIPQHRLFDRLATRGRRQ